MERLKSLNEQLEGTYFYAWNPYLGDRTLYIFHKGKGISLIYTHIFKLSLKDKKKLLKERFNDYTQERFEDDFKTIMKVSKMVIIMTKDGTFIYTDKYTFPYYNIKIVLFNHGNEVAIIKLEEIKEMYIKIFKEIEKYEIKTIGISLLGKKKYKERKIDKYTIKNDKKDNRRRNLHIRKIDNSDRRRRREIL